MIYVSEVPKDIPGIGADSLAPRLNPDFDPMQATGLTSESYFVLSRIDGRATLRELILMTGFSVEKAVGILGELRTLGALLMPGETPEQIRTELASRESARGSRSRPIRVPMKRRSTEERVAERAATVQAEEKLELDDSELTEEERGALTEESALSDAERRRVIFMVRRVSTADYFAVLGVSQDVDKRTLKRSYFKLSKEFHPDRYYGKETGPFAPWLAQVFEVCSAAYEVLSSTRERERYIASLNGEPARKPAGTQTKQEHATQLFEQGCALETRGDVVGALRLFGAVIRLDSQDRFLRRAARCALAAAGASDAADSQGLAQLAEEYASKVAALAPHDPSAARLLAHAQTAGGKLVEAEQTLNRALHLKNENDVLTGEMQEDLARVRKLLETRR